MNGLLEPGDIWEAPCRNHVCRTSGKLWGEVLLQQALELDLNFGVHILYPI